MPICCLFFTTWKWVKNDHFFILGWTISLAHNETACKRACESLSLRLIVMWTGTCRIPLRRPTNPPVAQEWCVWCWSMPAQILGGVLVVQSALVSSLYHTCRPHFRAFANAMSNAVNECEYIGNGFVNYTCVCVCVCVCDRWPICIDRTPIKKLQWEGRGLLAGERGEGPEFGPASWLGEVWIGVGSVVLSQQMAGLVLLGSPDGFSTGAHSNTPEYPRTSGLHFRAAS